MAMSSSEVGTGTYLKQFDIVASLDADSGALNIPHGMGTTPALISAIPLIPAGAAALSNWTFSVGATNIVATKNGTGAGSGSGSAQIRVTVMLPHTLVR
jgi:hypothetical protein